MEINKSSNTLNSNKNEQQNNKQDCYSLFKKYWWILLIGILFLIVINYLIFHKYYSSTNYNVQYDTRKLDSTIDDVSKLTTTYFNKQSVDSYATSPVRYINDISNQFHFMTDPETGIIYINKAFE